VPITFTLRRPTGKRLYECQFSPQNGSYPYVNELLRGEVEIVLDGHHVATVGNREDTGGPHQAAGAALALARYLARKQVFVDEEIG